MNLSHVSTILETPITVESRLLHSGPFRIAVSTSSLFWSQWALEMLPQQSTTNSALMLRLHPTLMCRADRCGNHYGCWFDHLFTLVPFFIMLHYHYAVTILLYELVVNFNGETCFAHWNWNRLWTFIGDQVSNVISIAQHLIPYITSQTPITQLHRRHWRIWSKLWSFAYSVDAQRNNNKKRPKPHSVEQFHWLGYVQGNVGKQNSLKSCDFYHRWIRDGGSEIRLGYTTSGLGSETPVTYKSQR